MGELARAWEAEQLDDLRDLAERYLAAEPGTPEYRAAKSQLGVQVHILIRRSDPVLAEWRKVKRRWDRTPDPLRQMNLGEAS